MPITNLLRVVLAIACATGASIPLAAGAQTLQIVAVKATGFGASEATAIRDAVLSAVGQINGESVVARISLSTRSNESSNGQRDSSRLASEDISVATNGIVKSYRVVAIDNDAGAGGMRAVVDVRVVAVAQSAQMNRLRLAVVSSDRPAPGLAPADTREAADFDAAFRDALNQALVATRRFAMLERDGAGVAEREFARIRGGGMAIEERARLRRQAAADLLVVTQVQRFGPDERTGKSLLTGTAAGADALTRDRIRAAVQVSVLDYSTGQVKYGTTVGGGARAGRDGVLGMARRLAAEAAAQLVEHSFPAEVIGIEGDRLTVSGSQGLFEVGDRVLLLLRGPALTDPHTGESLGRNERPLGPAVMAHAGSRFSVATVEPSIAARIKGLGAGQIVVRRSANQSPNLADAGQAASESVPAGTRSKSTLVSDKDW